MGSNYKKSAKDIAFDKERAKFKKEIASLQRTITYQLAEISDLNKKLNALSNELREKDDWVQRLLEYMDLSEDDLKKFINNEKIKADIYDSFGVMDKIFSKYFGRFYP